MITRLVRCLVVAFSLSIASLAALAQFDYDNISNNARDTGVYYSSTNEFGDEISWAGTDRTISRFSFYAHLNASTVSGQSVTLRLYNLGAGGAGPGTLLFTSTSQALALGSQTLSVTFPTTGSDAIDTATNSLIWTVQFSGLGGGDIAGLLVYNPPVTGSSFSDFWEFVQGSWVLRTLTGGTPANFAAGLEVITRVTAPPVITSATITAGNITVVWTGGGTLQSSPVLGSSAVWSNVDSDGSYTAPATGNKFFRVSR
jgi:hypothetical protein